MRDARIQIFCCTPWHSYNKSPSHYLQVLHVALLQLGAENFLCDFLLQFEQILCFDGTAVAVLVSGAGAGDGRLGGLIGIGRGGRGEQIVVLAVGWHCDEPADAAFLLLLADIDEHLRESVGTIWYYCIDTFVHVINSSNVSQYIE